MGRIIGTITLEKQSGRLSTGSICIRRTSGGWCELGNEDLASTNCWEFLDSLRTYLFIKMAHPWTDL